jgi:hypothetical protein
VDFIPHVQDHDRMRILSTSILLLALAHCGPRHGAAFGDGGDQDGGINDDGGGCDPLQDPFCDPNLDDSMAEAAPPCENLKCQQVSCGGGGTTSISGTVYDPAGKNPLYGIVVYIPNSPGAVLDPIPHGPVCDSCGGANISGKPIVTALTDPKGKFVLKDVPVGSNIPLVIQAGKWRRKLIVPSVQQCVDNPIKDTMVPDTRLRLPRTKNEFGGPNNGTSMPLIALTGGCDPVHILMQKIGIDISEFTNSAGNGMVRVYAGMGGQNAGVPNATDAYAFWGNKNEMFKYDIIINECECAPYKRDTQGPAFTNARQFLDSGGRMFNTHYHLNFYGNDPQNNTQADPELVNAATWTLWGKSGSGSAPYLIDTSFPKGKAMDDWLENLKTASAWGPSIKTTPKGQIQTFNVGDIGGTKMGISQRWIYPSSGNSVSYISINTPTSFMPDKRCGRAVGSDIHVGNGSLSSMTEQEAALEFMFFDLAACVIDDNTVPVPPTPN